MAGPRIASISSRLRRAQRNSTGAALSLDDLNALAGEGILHRLALLEADELCRKAGLAPPVWTFEIQGQAQVADQESDTNSFTSRHDPVRGAYSVSQLAERWDCSGALIRKMVHQGKLAKISGMGTIRISVAEVERYESTTS